MRLIIPSLIAQYTLKLSFNTYRSITKSVRNFLIFFFPRIGTESFVEQNINNGLMTMIIITYQSKCILYNMVVVCSAFWLNKSNRARQFIDQQMHSCRDNLTLQIIRYTKRRLKSTLQPMRRYRSCCKAGNCTKSSSPSKSLVLLYPCQSKIKTIRKESPKRKTKLQVKE